MTLQVEVGETIAVQGGMSGQEWTAQKVVRVTPTGIIVTNHNERIGPDGAVRGSIRLASKITPAIRDSLKRQQVRRLLRNVDISTASMGSVDDLLGVLLRMGKDDD